LTANPYYDKLDELVLFIIYAAPPGKRIPFNFVIINFIYV